MKGIKGIN